MTVVHIMPNVSRSVGGPIESLIGYAKAAGSEGIEVHVAAPSIPAEEEVWIKQQIPEVTFHFFAASGRHAWIVSPGLWMWLYRWGEQFKIIHVHGHLNFVSGVSAWLGVHLDVPTVIRPYGTLSRYTFSRRSFLKQLYFRIFSRSIFRRAAAVQFTTEAERREASRLPIEFGKRSHVVPPPWNGGIEPAFSGKANQPTVLFMSRLHPKKNIVALIEAWQTVQEAFPDAQLWIAGDGSDEYVQTLHDVVKTHNLGDTISFLGFVRGEEKRLVLRKAWGLALPSHQENFGVVVLEAIAAGMPVIISGEVQLRSFVENHELGIVVDRTDPKSIAEGIKSVLKNDSWRQSITEKGPSAIESTFSVERIGVQLREMYEQACRRSPSSVTA